MYIQADLSKNNYSKLQKNISRLKWEIFRKRKVVSIKNSVYIIVSGLLWGMTAIFVTSLKQTGFNSMQAVAIRVVFAAVMLILYILLKDPRQLKIKLNDIPVFIGTGVGSIVFFNYCYFEAIELIGGAAVPALLLYTSPIFVMILSVVFFGEKITAKKLISLLLTFSGLALVTGALTGGEQLSPYALFLGLGSGLGYALYSILGKFLIDKYSALTITAYTFITAAICITPFSGALGRLELLMSPQGIISAVALALISTVLPFLFYTKGLSGIEAGKASILAAIEPFAAAVVGVIFFDEQMTPSKIAGMALILLAVVILSLNFNRRPKKI